MKLILNLSVAGLFIVGLAVAAPAQSTSNDNVSLGSFARTERADKKPDTSKHFDNDNLPRTDKVSVVGDASQTLAADAAPAPAANASASANSQQDADNAKKAVVDQQAKVDLLTRELTVAQKESQLNTTDMYGDAGNRLRNSASWDKSQAATQDDIVKKQKELDDAKTDLADLQEQARHAGVTENDLKAANDAAKEDSSGDANQAKSTDSNDSTK